MFPDTKRFAKIVEQWRGALAKYKWTLFRILIKDTKNLALEKWFDKS